MGYNAVKLTPENKSKWGDTMSLMAWTAPGFRHLWYKLLAHNDGEYTAVPTKDIPIAATDGKNVLIHPEKFFSYSLTERVFIGAHEVVHNMYGDVETLHRMRQKSHVTCTDGTTYPYEETIMQWAMDYRINALLVESKIGTLPKDALFDLKIATAKDGLLDVYGKVYEKHPEGHVGADPGQHGWASLLPPGASTGQTPQQATQARNQQQWQVETAAAAQLEAMKSQGRVPGCLKQLFQEILEPKVPWTDHIQALINRVNGSGGYDWKRPDRRHIVRDLYAPSCCGFGAGFVVLWCDTSGSRSDHEILVSLGEIAGILEQLNPSRLVAVWNDAAISDIDEIEDPADLETIKARGYSGRGGTDVAPVFEWIAGQSDTPDMFIGFTDGYLSFPDQPPYPVIWASSTDHKYPYGDVVRVERTSGGVE